MLKLVVALGLTLTSILAHAVRGELLFVNSAEVYKLHERNGLVHMQILKTGSLPDRSDNQWHWTEAQGACSKEFDGVKGWRFPTQKENDDGWTVPMKPDRNDPKYALKIFCVHAPYKSETTAKLRLTDTRPSEGLPRLTASQAKVTGDVPLEKNNAFKRRQEEIERWQNAPQSKPQAKTTTKECSSSCKGVSR